MAQKNFKSIQMIDNNSNNEIVLKRDSFNDRFNEDLSQLLLSHLSFESKICFECVSKKWQKFIFNKQYSIQINSKPYAPKNNNCLNKLMKSRRNQNNYYKEIDLKAFESVLNKCKFIDNIDVKEREFQNKRQVLELITKYCPNLKSIAFSFNEIREQTLSEFGLKLGPNLRSLHFYQSEWNPNNYEDIHNNQVLKFCSILQTLKGVTINDFIHTNKSLMTKLQNIVLEYGLNDKLFVKTFTKTYKNSVKCLDISFVRNNDRKSQNSLLQELPHFEGLIELNLRFEKRQPFSQSIPEKLKKVALKCKQLKRLTIVSYTMDPKISTKVLDSMQYFTQIEFLKLMLFYWDKGMSIQSLEDCKQLTRLKLSNSLLKDDFFEGIHRYLPQLTHLNIEVKYVTNNCMKSLSKLPNLEALRILSLYESTFPKITDEGICALINESPKLRSLLFYSHPSITNKTIDSLISTAFSKPNILFKHIFCGKELEEIMKRYQKLPQNLYINTH
jgi:hypothetical protein